MFLTPRLNGGARGRAGPGVATAVHYGVPAVIVYREIGARRIIKRVPECTQTQGLVQIVP